MGPDCYETARLSVDRDVAKYTLRGKDKISHKNQIDSFGPIVQTGKKEAFARSTFSSLIQ